MRTLLTFCVLTGIAFGQSPVNPVTQEFYDISGNLIYICNAEAFQNPITFPAGGTLTNVVVLTNVGTITFSSTSFLWVGARITLSGSATSALNGVYKITTVSGSTATIATAGVANATYTDASLTTNSPLLNLLQWSIQVFSYNGSNQLTGSYWAGTASTAIPRGLACSARTSY